MNETNGIYDPVKFLSQLKDANVRIFYKLCAEHLAEITPLIYTPTVGDACLSYSHIYRRPEGLVGPLEPPDESSPESG